MLVVVSGRASMMVVQEKPLVKEQQGCWVSRLQLR